jgi:hypothetical protein
MPSRLEVQLDQTGQKVWFYAPEGRPSATPTAAVLAKDFSSSVDRAAADTYVTQETTNTTSNGATAVGAKSMTLDAVTGIEWRKSYTITNALSQVERVRVNAIDALTITFDEPLEFAHADEAAFQGTGFYYTLQAGDVDTLGEGYRIRFTYTVDSLQHIVDVPFDVVKVPLVNPLTVDFMKTRLPGITGMEGSESVGTDFADLRGAAWDRVCKAIRNAGTEPHHWRPALLKTPDDVEEWALAEFKLLLWSDAGVDVLTGDWDPQQAQEHLEQRVRVEKEQALNSLEWMDADDNDSRDDDEQRASRGPDFVA